MDNVYTVLIIVSLVGIWYFWRKKPNKKALISSAILLLASSYLFSTTSYYKLEVKSQEAESSSRESSSIKESKAESSKLASSKLSSSKAASSKSKKSKAKKASSIALESKKKVASESKKQASISHVNSIVASKKAKAKSSSVQKSKAKIAKSETKGLNSNVQVKKAIKKSNPNLKITSVNGVYMDPKSKDVAVEIKGQDAVSEKLTTEGFLMDVRSVWLALKESGDAENFENVNVSVKFPMTDEAGNDSNEYVVKTGISGFKINNLNVKRFLFKNVPTYADNYWQYPTLPKVN